MEYSFVVFSLLIIHQNIYFFQGLDKSPSKPVDNVTLKAPNATDIAGQRMDSYRFSMANLEGKTVIADLFANVRYQLTVILIVYLIFVGVVFRYSRC